MQQIESIILYCSNQINRERTIYSIYHLLNGKKSSQTIQDAHLFSLKKFFGIYDQLSREDFEEIIQGMLNKSWMKNIGNHRYCLTSHGMTLLEAGQLPEYINGWNYNHVTNLFWERLSLLIQVVSNIMFGETKYIPIQKNQEVHKWIKFFLKNVNIPKIEIGSTAYSELLECFKAGSSVDPSLVVFRLTGFHQIGLTPHQAARQLNLNIHDYQIGFTNTLHYLLSYIKEDGKQYKILPYLIYDLMQNDELTLTTRKTQRLLNQGYTLDMIANIRKLKLSTIEDHLVELALNMEGFSIDSYVDKELQKEILEISQRIATKQLKLIREKIMNATYFQIRLVLAKYGDR
ncbi:helix-turn-helix domain-containing protein [Neobacillus drentensis]|uniref:helix-turn-helix domain-containing protein n=1 Tax=Neobacillus drentensis TaxID=220684 RepID=UPI002FFDF97E